MAGLRLIIETDGLDSAKKRLSELVDIDDGPFLDALGALAVSQTQRRIASEKTGPDGTEWPENSEGTDLLVKSLGLLDSIDHQVKGNTVEWGSSKTYAAVHQFGAVIVPKEATHLVFSLGGKTIFAKQVTIPARPWLGLSASNERDMQDLMQDMLLELIR